MGTRRPLTVLACGQAPAASVWARLAAVILLLTCLGSPIRRAQGEPTVAPTVDGARLITLPIHLHRATSEGRPAAGDAFVRKQVSAANRFFRQYGVAFHVTAETRLPAGHARMETRVDRDRLGAFCAPGVINWFAVGSLRDVDEPERMRRGVHWHSRTHRPRHYVIVSAIAEDLVLAHELGHFLGNRRHSPTPNNLMSYEHTGEPPFLDLPQQRRMRRAIRRYLDSGELRAISAPPDPGSAER